MLAQSRLNNFLLADSIVFLSWATIFTASGASQRAAVLVTLAVLSSTLSIFWIGLGARQGVVTRLRWTIVAALEDDIDESMRTESYVEELRRGKAVEVRSTRFKLGFYSGVITSSNVLVLAPAVFLIASIGLIWASFAR